MRPTYTEALDHIRKSVKEALEAKRITLDQKKVLLKPFQNMNATKPVAPDVNFEQCLKKAWEKVLPVLDIGAHVSGIFMKRFEAWGFSEGSSITAFYMSRRPHVMFPSSKAQIDKTFGFHILGSVISPGEVKSTIVRQAKTNKDLIESRYFNVEKLLKDLEDNNFWIDKRCLRVWSIAFNVNFEIHNVIRSTDVIQSELIGQQQIEGAEIPTIIVKVEGFQYSLMYAKSPVKVRRYEEPSNNQTEAAQEVIVIDQIDDGSISSDDYVSDNNDHGNVALGLNVEDSVIDSDKSGVAVDSDSDSSYSNDYSYDSANLV